MAQKPSGRTRDQRDPAQQRVYVGVTGLAAVFLLTLLAASVFAMLGQNPHPAPRPPADSAAGRQMAVDEQPKEPLAELGVAPGNAPKSVAGNVTGSARPAKTPPRR